MYFQAQIESLRECPFNYNPDCLYHAHIIEAHYGNLGDNLSQIMRLNRNEM